MESNRDLDLHLSPSSTTSPSSDVCHHNLSGYVLFLFGVPFRSFFFFFSPGFIFLGIVDQIFVGSGCCRGDQQTVNDQQWITIFYNGRVCTFDLTEIQVE